MNQTQRLYIKKRVEEILSSKISAAVIKHTTPAVNLTNSEKIALIRSGKVKLKSDKELTAIGAYSVFINTIYDFSAHERKKVFDKEAYGKTCKVLRAKANEIVDGVMIGDAEEALKMIKEFENFEG